MINLNSPSEEPNGSGQQQVEKTPAAPARINIPMNLGVWKHLSAEMQHELAWFHQHALDNNMGWPEVCDALGYDRSTIHRILYGTYEGSWKNVISAIASYRRIAETRGTIQKNFFVETSASRLIFAALNYALANNSITLITGPSRRGKSISAREWCERNNHGRSVFVTVPPIGGPKMLLRLLCRKIGVGKELTSADGLTALYRAFNRNRILVLDEAHRLATEGGRANNLEIIRAIHDETGCAVALIATARFHTTLTKSDYQFEQVLGRIGQPVRLPKKVALTDVLAIVRQYIQKPGETLQGECERIANDLGGLGILVEILKVASRMAAKEKKQLAEQHIWQAIKFRSEMSGGN